ncbi:potassium voltage-gated channel subfamily A member 2-like isoform X2 [Bolinopsis microptera]|uniref:potassium voltage-gated channel subfamily A member 2-like isoform X2 n=1 Tax=Bolinopsis microptera TaxID=2820187 RepID=UPI00307A9D2A
MPLQQNFRPPTRRAHSQKDIFKAKKADDMQMTRRPSQTSRPSLTVNNHQTRDRAVSSSKNRDIVTLNVGGLCFQTRRSTLRRYPETLLGSDEIESYYEAERGEYFFDRNRAVFQPILGYYLSNGVMCLPSHINPDIFVEELRFFKMGPHVISRFAIQQASSQWLINQGMRFCHPLQKKLWMCLDNPDSGRLAKVIAYLDLVIILIAVVAQCLESLPQIRAECPPDQSWNGPTSCVALLAIEAVSNIWFTLNFTIRFVCCPDKRRFAKSVLNWFDLLAILPFYLDLIFRQQKNLSFLMVLRFFRTLRIVRIFKMSRYFQGLFALGYALSSSAGELVILALMLITFVVLFSSLIFFTEQPDEVMTVHVNNTFDFLIQLNSTCNPVINLTNMLSECGSQLAVPLTIVLGNKTITISDVQGCEPPPTPSNQFDSIITGFWWSIITMSTVGYGDYAPKTAMGKVVGSLCALTGILVISLPFPLIINRFNNFMRLRSANGNSRYSTIENGLNSDIGVVPEYSGVAFGFFSKDRIPRVADKEDTDC